MIEWWGPIIYEYYAGTEGNGFVACNSEEWLAHPGTVGKALIGIVHIVDDERRRAAGRRDRAPIYFEGGATFEYHNDPEKTKGSRTGNGWTTLGDIGYLDEDGFLYLTDRKAYMIICGGVNIYPQEAENLLVTHPKVLDVAVFGVPNEDFGEEVKAVVQPVDMADAGPDLERELIAFCKEHLAGYQVPPLDRLRRRAAPPPHRQALQAPAPGPLLGREREEDLIIGSGGPSPRAVQFSSVRSVWRGGRGRAWRPPRRRAPRGRRPLRRTGPEH